jgi:hypothetical protein
VERNLVGALTGSPILESEKFFHNSNVVVKILSIKINKYPK